MNKYINLIWGIILLFSVSCTKENLEQVIHQQPNSFQIQLDGDFVLDTEAGDKVGINGVGYPVLLNGLVSLIDVPVAENYLICYPFSTQKVEGEKIQFTYPLVQTYSNGAMDSNVYWAYGVTSNEDFESLKLKPICGGLKIKIPATDQFSFLTSVSINSSIDTLSGDAEVDVLTGKVSFKDNPSTSLSLVGSIDIQDEREVLFALPEMVFSDVLNVIFEAEKGTGTCQIDVKGKSIIPGECLEIETKDIVWTQKTAYYGTANSVIVKPGQTSVTMDCAPYYTTSKYYYYENHPDVAGIMPKSAKLLWSDISSDFVKNVTLSEDAKSFTAELSGQSGNAVIAIYDKEDPSEDGAKILWSFHIWVSDVEEQVLENGYIVLDRNLGAVSVIPGDVRSIGFLYQWGRKDPFVSTDKYGTNTNGKMYGPSGELAFSTVGGGSSTGTVDYSIQNPMKFIKYSRTKSNTSSQPFYYSYDWLYYADNGLWGNPQGYEYPEKSMIKKSIYDPSPAGYMIAPADTWKGKDTNVEEGVFANGHWDNDHKGLSLEDTGNSTWWYAIGGWRGRKDGKLTTADSSGYYWYSTVAGEKSSNALLMSISEKAVKLDASNSRANACSIRCIKMNY